mgnify:CR=1 FL=1
MTPTVTLAWLPEADQSLPLPAYQTAGAAGAASALDEARGALVSQVFKESPAAKAKLEPGDVILTGTPDGVVNVQAGDEIVCEVTGIGRLLNTIVDDSSFLSTQQFQSAIGVPA